MASLLKPTVIFQFSFPQWHLIRVITSFTFSHLASRIWRDGFSPSRTVAPLQSALVITRFPPWLFNVGMAQGSVLSFVRLYNIHSPGDFIQSHGSNAMDNNTQIYSASWALFESHACISSRFLITLTWWKTGSSNINVQLLLLYF